MSIVPGPQSSSPQDHPGSLGQPASSQSRPTRPAQPPAGRPQGLPVHRSNGRFTPTPVSEAEEAQARAAFEQARAGQRSAYGVVVRIYQHRLFNAVYRMVGNREDAAEITQEAFTRGLEKLSDFRGDSGPYTWLFRIAMNAAVSRIRRSSRRRTVSLDAMDAPEGGRGGGGSGRGRFTDSLPGRGITPSESAQMSEAHRAVVGALNQLDPEYRALLVMRDLEGFDYRQMADVLGLPLGTLKSRLFRARMALRDLLAPQFERKEAKH